MPKNLLRSSRLSKNLSPIVEKFLSSIKDDVKIAFYDVLGTQVHNIMLIEEGIVSKADGSKILNELQTIKHKILEKTIDYDMSFEDIHPFIEDQVIEKLGIETGGKLHSGRSRNDQVVLDIKLKIRDDIINVASKMIELDDILQKLSKKYTSAICPLYTHTQRAQLGTFSHYFLSYASELHRHLNRLFDCLIRLNSNPLGAGAVGGTSFPINRHRTMELLGFDTIQLNSLDAVSSRDYTLELISIYSMIAIYISRIAEDLILWSSGEFKFVIFDDAFSSVSSALPQKKNPDTAELLRANCAEILGKMVAVYTIQKSLFSGYNRDFQQIKPLIWDSKEILTTCLDILIGILSSLEINSKNMEKATQESNLIALDIAEYLVISCSISFRMAHSIVGSLVQHNPQNLVNSKEIQKIAKDQFNISLQIDQQELEKFQTPLYCLERRKSEGNPSQEQQIIMLKTLQTEVAEIRAKFDAKSNLFKDCIRKIDDIIMQYIQE